MQALLEQAQDEVDLDGLGDDSDDADGDGRGVSERESVLEYLKGEYDVVRVLEMAKEEDAKRAAAAAVGDINLDGGGSGGDDGLSNVDLNALLSEHESIVGQLRSSSGGGGGGGGGAKGQVHASVDTSGARALDANTLTEFERVSAMASAGAEAILAENSSGGGGDFEEDYDGLGGGEEGQVMRLLQQLKEEGDLGL